MQWKLDLILLNSWPTFCSNEIPQQGFMNYVCYFFLLEKVL